MSFGLTIIKSNGYQNDLANHYLAAGLMIGQLTIS